MAVSLFRFSRDSFDQDEQQILRFAKDDKQEGQRRKQDDSGTGFATNDIEGSRGDSDFGSWTAGAGDGETGGCFASCSSEGCGSAICEHRCGRDDPGDTEADWRSQPGDPV